MPRFEGSGERQSCEEGYYNAAISYMDDITDRVSQYADWAFEVIFNAEGVGFELKTSFFVKMSRQGNGELNPEDNGWSKQFNNFLDTINYDGGFDRFGVFRDPTGEEVRRSDIVTCLSTHIATEFSADGYPFVLYVEKDKKGYMAPVKRVYLEKDRKDLVAFVEYLKKKSSKPVGQFKKSL